MDSSQRRNVDPRLRRVPGARVAARVAAEPVFVEVANQDAAEWVASRPWVSRLVHLVEGYYTAEVAPGRVDDLAAGDGVIEVEAVRQFQPHLVKSLKRIRADAGSAGGGGALDGKGVVIGFVDYGLDFTQKDFQNSRTVKDAHNPDGITRVAYLWDQQLRRRKGERAPKKYGYGVEYSSKEIDRALRRKKGRLLRHDPRAARDIAGHGTHVAGIAAGNGETADGTFKRGDYAGVAPAATLVFVNLDRAKVVGQVQAQSGTLANSVHIAHGIVYCFEKADELGMPCVVNLSLGCNGGGHDGNMALEWIIDALLRKPGRAVVIAAGNDDDKAVHAAGTLERGERAELEWKIGDEANQKPDPNPNELEVWYPRGSEIRVQLVAPGDEPSRRKVDPGQGYTYTLAGGETVTIHSDADTPWNGAARIYIGLEGESEEKGIRFGKWIVKLQAIRVGEAGGSVRFHAWIERTLPAGGPEAGRSRFAKRELSTTLATPCTGQRSIVVASFDNTQAEAISAFSGRGRTRDGRPKPELAAPGFEVFSTQAGAGLPDEFGKIRKARVKMDGTSMAAPHVAGVVARMLGRNAYLTAEEICEILVKSATPPAGGTQGKWNSKWGYGRLNAARAVDLVEQLVGSRRTAS